MPDESFARGLEDDGLYLPTIKEHSLEKFRRHNYYARVFASSMKAKWPQRAYIGLYSGAGRARLKSTQEVVETTAMSALRLPDQFTHYIFVDNDPRCTAALRMRSALAQEAASVQVIEGDVTEVAPAVRRALPAYGPGNGLLSFCFVDPFAATLKFDVIRELSDLRMDFLILLMLGLDARVNFRQYYSDVNSSRIGDLVDCPDWRAKYDQSTDRNVVRFLTRKFDEAMVRLGYLSAPADSFHRVTASGTSVLQYVLAFYSKDPLGQRFWKDTLAGSTKQTTLDL